MSQRGEGERCNSVRLSSINFLTKKLNPDLRKIIKEVHFHGEAFTVSQLIISVGFFEKFKSLIFF